MAFSASSLAASSGRWPWTYKSALSWRFLASLASSGRHFGVRQTDVALTVSDFKIEQDALEATERADTRRVAGQQSALNVPFNLLFNHSRI